ncbi:family 20 glycosylhydrolase [Luteibacter sp. ME-Dv--P-043b]|uniref:family 20 glycosylhydrolase n=1 Tax=Luteibacter sp. ME-Dv--P-043b TaxID=3040291 RepID=UPI0025558BDF|nr:family 20 glycosylhydrolase [Luteibacter sp. ME-Dv--P-043b]
MRRTLLLVLVAGLSACAQQPPKHNVGPIDDTPLSLIPQPAQMQRLPGRYTLDPKAAITVAPGDTAARHVAAQLQGWVRQARGITLAIVEGKPRGGGIVLATSAAIKGREAYTLDVDGSGVRIAANDETGLYYGAVTYAQLLTDPAAQAGVPGLHIVDAPRFEWRGLMLDSSRHFQSVSEIEHLLDQMAMHKLNTFHWHLTDDQGWRLQITKYPKLTEIGACRKTVGPDIALTGSADTPYCGFYTQDEAKQIVAYAAERHITVVPEIEMPGHAQAAVAAYPKLGNGKKLTVSSDWGVNTALFNTDDATFVVLQDVLDEVMAIFPSTYIHVGGDEAAKDEWEHSKSVQARMKTLGITDEEKMQGWFVARIGDYLETHGRRLIGWDEILDGKVPASATVMSWRGTAGAIKAANAGHDVVMAPSPTLYLDRLQSTLPDEPAGRPSGQTLKTIYDFDPVPAGIAPDKAQHVLGEQVTVFTEYLPDWYSTQHAIFPRMAAVAERTWSPKADWNSFIARLPAQMARYRAAGIVPADGVFAVAIASEATADGKARVTLSNQSGYGTIRYTTDGTAPTSQSTAYTAPFDVALPTTVRANTFQNGFGLAGPRDRSIDAASLLHRTSDGLDTCTDKLALRLSAVNAVDGVRPVYKVDIMDTCWMWKGVNLDGRYGIDITVDRLPYNYALWKDAAGIVARKARSAAGEIEVHQDTCTGPKLATLPLAKAKDGRATLQGTLPKRDGTHDLCFVITGKPGPKLWVIGDVQLR